MLKKVWDTTDETTKDEMEKSWNTAIVTNKRALADPAVRDTIQFGLGALMSKNDDDEVILSEQPSVVSYPSVRSFKSVEFVSGVRKSTARRTDRTDINDMPAPNFQRVLHHQLATIHTASPRACNRRKDSTCVTPAKMKLGPSPSARAARIAELAAPGRLSRGPRLTSAQGSAASPRRRTPSIAYGLRVNVGWKNVDARQNRISELALPAGLALPPLKPTAPEYKAWVEPPRGPYPPTARKPERQHAASEGSSNMKTAVEAWADANAPPWKDADGTGAFLCTPLRSLILTGPCLPPYSYLSCKPVPQQDTRQLRASSEPVSCRTLTHCR